MTTTTRKPRDEPEVKATGKGREARPPIDPRIRARRVEIKRSAGRRRLRWVAALGVVLLVVLVLVGLAFTPLLDVDRLTVAGQFRTDPADVVAAGGIAPGDALATADLGAAARRVEGLAWVAEASVQRRWPGTLRYRIVERVPVAAVQSADAQWVAVDGEGRVLASLDGKPADLPVLEGVSIDPAVGSDAASTDVGPFRVAAGIPTATRPLIDAVVLSPDGATTIRLAAGGTVTVVALTELGEKGVALGSVLAAVDPCVATLDLSLASSPVLTRTPGCG